MVERVGSRSGLRGGVVPVVVVVLLLAAACGSGSSSGSAKGPAGAKENAASTAVCRDLYTGGPVAACAENTIGPGGGVVFYDAGSVQSWGRFLEVAPWNWNPQLAPTEEVVCTGRCGAKDSFLKPLTDRTQDGGKDVDQYFFGYSLCPWGNVPVGASTTGTALGAGPGNTNVLLAACGAAAAGQAPGAVNLVATYRGGGLADWFLPSKDELDRLYRFGNRDAIGGFTTGTEYLSSSFINTVGQSDPNGDVWVQNVVSGATKAQPLIGNVNEAPTPIRWPVRPIRAFS